MGIYRVEVGDLGWTFLEARTEGQAVHLMEDELLGLLHVSAKLASPKIRREWAETDPDQRADFLMRLSRPAHYLPTGLQRTRTQLERELEEVADLERWLERERGRRAPLTPREQRALTAILRPISESVRRRGSIGTNPPDTQP